MLENITRIEFFTILGGYLLLLFTSGVVVKTILSQISEEPLKEKIGKDAWDTGWIVGKCENLLILTFMLLDAYTALALIFAAKTIVRK